MPKLVCITCGRQIYTVAPLKALFAEERICLRCGNELIADRRSGAPESRAIPQADPQVGDASFPERRAAGR